MKFIQKTFYVSKKALNNPVMSSQDIYEQMKHLANADQESFWVIGYTAGNVEIYRDCLFLGGINSSTIDNKILFKRLIMNDCSTFVVIHNHPGGDIIPSNADKDCTAKIQLVAELLNMSFLDHIIIGQNNYFSFADEGLL